MCRVGDVVVRLTAGKMEGGDESRQGRFARVDTVRGNLVAREHLPSCRIGERNGTRRKISAAHRVGRHRGVLVEHVVVRSTAVVDLKARAPVLVAVKGRNRQRSTERRAEAVVGNSTLRGGPV